MMDGVADLHLFPGSPGGGPGGGPGGSPGSGLPAIRSEPKTGVRAGRVVSTAGSQIIMLLDNDGSEAAEFHMGSLVTMRSSRATIYGIVEGLSTPMPTEPSEGKILRLAEVGLLARSATSRAAYRPLSGAACPNCPRSTPQSIWPARRTRPPSTPCRTGNPSGSARCTRMRGCRPASASMTCCANISPCWARPAAANPAP